MTTERSERTRLPGSLIVLLVLIGVSVFINYIDRGNLSIAAAMVQEELHINPAQLGMLLSAFFWTYALLQPVYGWLADRVNVYFLFAGCFCAWSLATAATGLVHTFIGLFALRLIVGMGEAASFPAYSKIIALNYPEEHRGVANSVLAMGLALGPGFGILLSGSLMSRFGWRPFFVVLGLGSMLWVPLWLKWSPRKNLVAPASKQSSPSLVEFLYLRSAWGSCIGLFCGNYVNYFLLTWLPYYLLRERHFSMVQMARVGATAYFVAAGCSGIGGWLSDRWIRSGATVTRVRKTFVAGGYLMCGTFLLLSALVADARTAVPLLWLATAGFGVSASNVWAIPQTLAGPQAAGRWVGFQNCLGNMAGVVVPVVTGFVLRQTGNFRAAFVIVAVVLLIGAASWTFLVGKIEQVAWKESGALLAAEASA